MRAARPQRGSQKPGDQWYYNNWDFNALGVIFETQTGKRVGDALKEWLADPLGMQDFDPTHVVARTGRGVHPQYLIGLSARDLARVGQLVLDGGVWKGKPVVPADYLERATAPLTAHAGDHLFPRYGYSWWVSRDGKTTAATGFGRQLLLVDRAARQVVVTRAYTGVNLFEYGLWSTPLARKPGPEHLLLVLFLTDRAFDRP